MVLKIHSMHLVNTLRDVIEFWPGLSLVSAKLRPLQFAEPYTPLVIFEDQIENYKTNDPTTHCPSYIKQCNDHIDMLLTFLDQAVGDETWAEKALHSKSPSMAIYKNLWMLFKPRKLVYIHATDDEPARPMIFAHIRMYVISRNSGRKMLGRWDEGLKDVRGWYVETDGVCFRPIFASATIEPFDGERQISSLPVYPKEFHKDCQYEKYLEQRGK